jgi:hypothetical protein
MNNRYVQAVVEDVLQEAILHKLLNHYRPDISLIGVSGKRGNNYIRQSIRGFNEASQFLPHIVLTDLDRIVCAPQLISDWIDFEISSQVLFRVAEKEIDAWILSDREEFAKFLGVPCNKIPVDTQELADPKQYIINLARRSRKKIIKDIIPSGLGTQGPGYNLLLQDFVINAWNPDRASENNLSLQKAIIRLRDSLR